MKILTSPIFWFIIIFDIVAYFSYKKVVGWFGEHWVKKELKKLSDEYLIINNLMIKTNDAKTHQIDHVIVSCYGIFVIETKQINGYIYGDDYQEKWVVYSKKKKYFVNNPVHQNYGHLLSLKEILGLEKDKFISIVCISSTAKLKLNSKVALSITNLLEEIKKYKIVILPNYEEIYNKLKSSNIKNIKINKEHVNMIHSNICPKCGNELVLRNGKNGEFMGCSNYPKCKYTRNVK